MRHDWLLRRMERWGGKRWDRKVRALADSVAGRAAHPSAITAEELDRRLIEFDRGVRSVGTPWSEGIVTAGSVLGLIVLAARRPLMRWGLPNPVTVSMVLVAASVGLIPVLIWRRRRRRRTESERLGLVCSACGAPWQDLGAYLGELELAERALLVEATGACPKCREVVFTGRDP